MTTQENTISVALKDDINGMDYWQVAGDQIWPEMTVLRDGTPIGQITVSAHLRLAWTDDGFHRAWVEVDPLGTEGLDWSLSADARYLGVSADDLLAAILAVCRVPDGYSESFPV